MTLATKNVFIDTQFYVNADLNFEAQTFKSFEELCQKGELVHITSTVVEQEVKKKILEFIKEGLKNLANFKKRAGFLANDADLAKEVFTEKTEDELKKKGYDDFCEFLEATNARIVDMSKVDSNEILEMFFKQIKPFGAKKPNEFRDAFSLLAIRSALKRGEKIYVISADPDHKAFCQGNDQFISVETLSGMLDICYKHIDARSKFVEKFLQEKNDAIRAEIRSLLNDADGYNISTWEDAELDRFEVIEIEDFEPEITHLDAESCLISFDVAVKFKVYVTGPDTANSYYDKEDDVLHVFDTSERTDEEEFNFTVEIELTFESDEGEFINEEFKLSIIDLHKGIEFGVEEYPYEDPRM
ncbi:PIN domain-containing protein [Pseudomonas syringae]